MWARLLPRAFSTLFFVMKKKQSLELSYRNTIYNFNSNSIYTFGVGNLPASFQVSSEIEVVLVYLHPGISCLLHNDDAHLYTNQCFEITDIDQETRALNEKLANAHSKDLKWLLIQDYLIRKFQKNLPGKYDAVAKAIDLLYVHSGNLSVEDLAQDVFTCRRNLYDLFMQYVGFSPKKYADIIRFNSFVNLYTKNPGFLSDIVFQCGYHDLSHLNKDFLRYIASSPSDYLGNVTAEINNWYELDCFKP